MNLSLVEYRLDPPAGIVTIKRSDRRNALSNALVAELSEVFDHAASDASRCVILTAEGLIFSAGLDLVELGGMNEERIHATALRLATLFEKISTCPKPTIAAVNGSAYAGGAGLVSVCDLALAVPESEFGYPGVRRGLAAAVVIPPLLRHVGERVARFMLLTGESIDVATAVRVGLINAVVPTPDLHERAMAWARSLAEGGPNALTATRSLLQRCGRSEPSVEELAALDTAAWTGSEAREGLEAFAQKRLPSWSPISKG